MILPEVIYPFTQYPTLPKEGENAELIYCKTKGPSIFKVGYLRSQWHRAVDAKPDFSNSVGGFWLGWIVSLPGKEDLRMVAIQQDDWDRFYSKDSTLFWCEIAKPEIPNDLKI